LVRVLNASAEWLICSLVHKFGASEEGDVDAFLADIHSHLPKGFRAKGEAFVFVDECHRTQSGKLHDAMKALLPGAMLIGFTGTPLLKSDKRRSIETFGPYIHTYKYDEAVRDGVVLDLRYEARDIDQSITSPAKVDQWFELKTQGLTDVARAQLKQRWGTMQKVLSARDRLEKIVADVLMDMETRDRLKSGHGNALLVSSSIYSACRFFEMFRQTDLAGKYAIVTSYRPQPSDIKGEETGEGMTERLRQYSIYRRMLAEHFDEAEATAMHKEPRSVSGSPGKSTSVRLLAGPSPAGPSPARLLRSELLLFGPRATWRPAERQHQADELGLAGRAGLRVDPLQVGPHGLGANVEDRPDLGKRHSLGESRRDAGLRAGEPMTTL
jgi:type I restriction enzyme R subunit